MEQTGPSHIARVAAVYDLHGNPFALQAVLQDIEASGVDAVLVGGDIAWGPFPRATVELVLGLAHPTTVIRGNADREVGSRADPGAGLDDVVADINAWCADQLNDEQRRWLRDLQATTVLDIGGLGPTLFCHGSPRSDEEALTTATPRQRLDAALRGVEPETVVCGHTHMQFDLVWGGHRVVNAGSIGMPYEDEGGAYWALLGPDVELRRTAYDLDEAVEKMAASTCPHVEMVFVETLREPPPQAEVIAQFEAIAATKTF